ncbi:protein URE2 [Scaptodrosophila lebanonensis]|uniref:Protein URE2 n=1 Tax=Drosophila lebanonensis TaxID=7225 RepID=A0A6J2TQS6_DROLE|nr:protein URE2 [Scaptodrosophila lebanonensis]
MTDYQDITALEKSVANAGTQLYTMAHKLHAVERSLDQTTMEQMDEMEVLELLESMTEVKNEYQNLRKDIQEVQQLQRDVSTSIRFQMRSMQQTFQMLKKRIATSQQQQQQKQQLQQQQPTPTTLTASDH